MEQRINIQQRLPEAWKALYQLSAVLNQSPLSPKQQDLIKIRASQINACAFCLDMHTREALKAGETQQRIFLLNAWRETTLFSPAEKAILAVTEEVTRISDGGLSDATYADAQSFFNDDEIGYIILSATLINTWNRLAVSTQLQVSAA